MKVLSSDHCSQRHEDEKSVFLSSSLKLAVDLDYQERFVQKEIDQREQEALANKRDLARHD